MIDTAEDVVARRILPTFEQGLHVRAPITGIAARIDHQHHVIASGIQRGRYLVRAIEQKLLEAIAERDARTAMHVDDEWIAFSPFVARRLHEPTIDVEAIVGATPLQALDFRNGEELAHLVAEVSKTNRFCARAREIHQIHIRQRVRIALHDGHRAPVRGDAERLHVNARRSDVDPLPASGIEPLHAIRSARKLREVHDAVRIAIRRSRHAELPTAADREFERLAERLRRPIQGATIQHQWQRPPVLAPVGRRKRAATNHDEVITARRQECCSGAFPRIWQCLQ